MIFRYFRISRQKGGVEQKNHVSVLSKLLGPECPQKRGFYVISIKLTQNEHSGKKEGHFNSPEIKVGSFTISFDNAIEGEKMKIKVSIICIKHIILPLKT